ncbi:MAG TPA: hypothetical protein VGK20_01830 [Candidatus Binatia bacterium]|jgi:hypothetical protein
MATYHGSCHCGRVTFEVEALAVTTFDGRNWERAALEHGWRK